MKTIKETSTQQENKREVMIQCPVHYTLEKIGGRWKPLLLFNLMGKTLRYNELRRALPKVSEKMLIQHLRELELDGLIDRKVHPVVPPHVEYSLTAKGQGLGPILNAMAQWGLSNKD